MVANLYVHFPFCRRKCSYCALYSRAGTEQRERDEYVARLAEAICGPLSHRLADGRLRTVYFGGGSPAMCDLCPIFAAIKPRLAEDYEFTVELHPLDVTADLLKTLKDGGVNRISMGVQSMEDAVLADMGRGYTFSEAERAFYLVKEYFDNAGIDLIVGYPGESAALTPRHARLAKWGLRHCSVYSLILEEKSILGKRLNGRCDLLPTDDETMNRLAVMARFLQDLGLVRYEISNYAVPGFECRHNLAVWRGEDYYGLGDGAFGRAGLKRTSFDSEARQMVVEEVDPETDFKERMIFCLRTREGLDVDDGKIPKAWMPTLDKFVEEGLVCKSGTVYRLTERGTEVCDSILSELV